MEKFYGIVKEVYIPDEYKNGNLLDVMDRNVIGFKVLIDDEVQDFQFEQNEFNVNIMKNDEVLIIKQVIDGKEFVDIEVVDYE